MINFNSKISGLDNIHIHQPFLWQLAENSLHFSEISYQAIKVQGKTIFLKPTYTSIKPTFISSLKKIVIYLTISPFLFLIRTAYRRSYQFKIIPLNNKEKSQLNNEENPLLPVVKIAYQLDDVIARLHEAQSRGLKLGLFVGRTSNQTIPQENGWLWCSLDCEEIKEKIPDDRLHLKMDLNKYEEICKIRHLFDKVVSDLSVIKFMSKPWVTLKSLLVCKPHAELIAESWSGITRISTTEKETFYSPQEATMTTPLSESSSYHQLEKKAFSQWKQKVSEQEAESQYQNFLTNMKEERKKHILYMHNNEEIGLRLEFMRKILEENHLVPKQVDYRPELLKRIKVYLLKLFDEVNLVENQLYPYREGIEASKAPYWVMRSPK